MVLYRSRDHESGGDQGGGRNHEEMTLEVEETMKMEGTGCHNALEGLGTPDHEVYETREH